MPTADWYSSSSFFLITLFNGGSLRVWLYLCVPLCVCVSVLPSLNKSTGACRDGFEWPGVAFLFLGVPKKQKKIA